MDQNCKDTPTGERSNMKIDESWYIRPEGVPDRTSAGGIVVREQDGQVLIALVKEDEPDYILPKGGVKRGETIEAAARREIQEEAGISDLELVESLGTRQRLDYERRKWITTHYFLFTTRQVEGFPTDEERSYRLEWFSLDELPALFWPEQRELIENSREKISRLFSK